MQAGQAPKILNLGGSLGVERASALRDDILEALSGVDTVLLDLSSAEEIDLACLQVLYAAKAKARASGKELHFLGSPPKRVAERLASCGFLRGLPERADEFESSLVGF